MLQSYKVPQGLLFRIVCCPNYTTEILAWVFFTLGTGTVAAGVFTLVGAVQMSIWAKAKYRRLRNLFGDRAYPKRYIILPPFY